MALTSSLSSPRSRIRRARLASLTLSSLLIGLIVAEIVLRLNVAVRGEPKELINYMRLVSGEDTGLYQPDPERLYAHKPGVHRGGRVRINEDGFRDSISPRVPKRTDERRILLVGGSTTFGIGLPDGEVWSASLGRRLDQALDSVDIEIVNAGVGGYTTAESLVALETRGLGYRPDVVVLGHVYNDVNARTVHDGFRPTYSHYRRAEWRTDDRVPWLAWSHLYNLGLITFSDARFYRSVYYMTVRDFDGDTYYGRTDMGARLRRLSETDTSVFTANLRRMIQLARSVDALPVLLTGPLAPSAWPSMSRGVEEGNEAIRVLAGEEGALLIDLARIFPSDDPAFFRSATDPMHMSKAGAERRARIVADALLPLLRGETDNGGVESRSDLQEATP